jgi:hypothetical protein
VKTTDRYWFLTYELHGENGRLAIGNTVTLTHPITWLKTENEKREDDARFVLMFFRETSREQYEATEGSIG